MNKQPSRHRENEKEKIPMAVIDAALELGAENTSLSWIASFDFLYMDDAIAFKDNVESIYKQTYNITLIWKNGVQRARAYLLL